MNSKSKNTAYLLLSLLVSLLSYIIIHETGHLIVMLSAGAKITEFSILTAHVSAVGGNYTVFSDLWLHANGVILPILVSLTYILLYKRVKESPLYRIFSYVFSLAPIMALLPWVVTPFTFIKGSSPAGDDATKFLYNFSKTNNPMIVSAVSLVIIALYITLILKKV